MRLLRDLWRTSPGRTAVVGFLVLVGAAARVGAAGVAGGVLLHRSWFLFGLLAAALAVAVASDITTDLVAAGLTADWAATVRRELARRAFGQDVSTLEATPVGELMDRIDGDVSGVAAELRGAGVHLVESLVFGVLSVLTATLVWWPAGLAMLGVAGALVVGLRRRVGAIGPVRVGEEAAWSDLVAVMEEGIHGQDDVRTSLARPHLLRLFAHRAAVLLGAGRRVWLLSARVSAVAAGVLRMGVAVLVVVGALALHAGAVDAARLTGIWLLVLAFSGSSEQLSRVVPRLQNAVGAWSRIQQLRDCPQEPSGGAEPADADLVIRGLTFAYPAGGEQPALRDVSLTLRRGRSYAVLGRTGSGKSTLGKVLTRAVDVPRGTVHLGDVDLLDLDLDALRRAVAIVPQRTEILAGSLAENIALFDPGLIGLAGRALDELGLSGWVAELPDGLDTRLGDGGHPLSAGQAQLVAFARILVRDPHVVILDEATARLDPVTEARVQRATDRLLRDRIGIVIAHRLTAVRRCEVIVLDHGVVLEAGPLAGSGRFAELSAIAGRPADPDLDRAGAPQPAAGFRTLPRVEPPPVPPPVRTRTVREILRLTTNDPRYGVAAIGVFLLMILFGLDGSVLAWGWADLVDGTGGMWWPVVALVAALVLLIPAPYLGGRWYPEWWLRQLVRIHLRLLYGQTGSRRISGHPPAEVIAQASDAERVVVLADNLINQFIGVFILVSMTVVAHSVVPALFFGAAMLVSAVVAVAFGPMLERAGGGAVRARARYATALVSSLAAAPTVKLTGAVRPVLAHLAGLDRARSARQRREISLQVLARSTPALASGLLPVGVWALYLAGHLGAGAALVAVSTLGAARWFAWTTASLVSQLPSARVWTRRTVTMTGHPAYSAPVAGVDLTAGTGPGPAAVPRHPLRRLELSSFTAVHEDGTVGAAGVDLTVHRGQLVLLLGPVGAGKSSLLRALAGIVHHTGTLRWNGEPVTEPELFLRPNQVGYVGQLPRVFSGTVADNVRVGHAVDVDAALAAAQLGPDLSAAGVGPSLLIGHKGLRLSGGQLQRLALARALAPGTELLIADDVSSALDIRTEIDLWRALRERGVTVVGSTSKQAALRHADQVVVLVGGRPVARGPWTELAQRWSHLAG